jgi:hypothetical protein
MQAEKKVQWQAAEGEDAAAKEELKKEESSESEEEEQEEITGCLLPQDLSKLDVAALTPLTPEVIRCCANPASPSIPIERFRAEVLWLVRRTSHSTSALNLKLECTKPKMKNVQLI